jgi:hypothetical protein
MSFAICLQITRWLLAAWAFVSAAEWLRALGLFHKEGLLSWEVLRLRPGTLNYSSMANVIFSTRSVALVLTARLLASVALIVTHTSGYDILYVGAILCSCVYLNYRTCFGGDGSDQMGFIVCVGTLLMLLGNQTNDAKLGFAGVLLIGGQSVISYFVAGASKLVSPVWRQGGAILGVMRTETYGHTLAVRIIDGREVLQSSICWTVIIAEIAFPLVLVVPSELLIVAFVGFALFHFSNAFFMGLNAFVWPFIATYPSVALLNGMVRDQLY